MLRLSCLYALLDKTDKVEVSHLNAAYALWRYCEDSARHVFGDMLGDPLADELCRMLRRAGQEGLTRTDINNALGRHVKSTLIGQALARLQREGFARIATQHTAGRPVETWYLMVPRVHAQSEKSEKSEKRVEGEIRKSLVQTLNGLHTAVQGICELRNQCGFASHGSDNPRPAMESVQALLAAAAADAIVGFLHRVHRQDRTPPPSPRAMYDEHPAFNAYVDDVHDAIRIFEAEFRPSDVLFQIEPETYRVYLAEFDAEVEDVEASAAPDVPGEVTP